MSKEYDDNRKFIEEVINDRILKIRSLSFLL